jgi:hypothetical protein
MKNWNRQLEVATVRMDFVEPGAGRFRMEELAMQFDGTTRWRIGLCCLGLATTWAPNAFAQASGSGGTTFSVQPMFVPVMTSNGQTTPVDPFMTLANPLYNPYGMGMGTGMTNQQLGLMMMTMPGRMGGIGSGKLSGVRPEPGMPKMTPGRAQALAAAEQDPSPVRRATRPAGASSRYFSRQSPSQRSEPRGRFDRRSRYFP